MRDVIFHVADSTMATGLKAFFSRDNWEIVLGCRRFEIDPENDKDIYSISGCTDGGVWKKAHINLALSKYHYRHAVIILDADFEPHPGAKTLCADITNNMLGANWAPESFCVAVIEPELESWLFANNLNVANALGHRNFDRLVATLASKGLWNRGDPKPNDLKLALKRAMQLGDKRTRGPIFKTVFSGISRRACDSCVEPGFTTMRAALQTWFPA